MKKIYKYIYNYKFYIKSKLKIIPIEMLKNNCILNNFPNGSH